jgi:hypothetical protein
MLDTAGSMHACLQGCSVVPLATPHAAFKITLTKGKALVFQPESGMLALDATTCGWFASASCFYRTVFAEDSVDTADWVSALQLATTVRKPCMHAISRFGITMGTDGSSEPHTIG